MEGLSRRKREGARGACCSAKGFQEPGRGGAAERRRWKAGALGPTKADHWPGWSDPWGTAQQGKKRQTYSRGGKVQWL